ncbi:MAG: carbohydrate kinase family protein [Anaerolineales bacterium]
MIEIITAGHTCMDVLIEMSAASAQSDSFLAPGRLVESGPLSFTPGGSVPNTGVALFKLGTDVRLIGRVGTDRVGALTREVLSAYSPALAEHLIVAPHEPSSYTVVISPPGIDRTFLHCPGPNDTFGPEHLDPEMLRQTQILHLGYPPLMRRMYADGGATLAETLARARGCGATVSLDLAMPDPARPSGQADWPAILAAALPQVDLFVPSVEELLYMLDRPTFDAFAARYGSAGMIDALSPETVEALAQQALHLGARVVFIKLGHRGAYLRTGACAGELGRGAPRPIEAWRWRQLWAPAYRVTVRGTVGAGDATVAGLLTAIVRGQGPAEAANSATAVGACSVEQTDAASGLLSWAATQRRIASGLSRRASGLEGSPAWRHDATADILRGPLDGVALG